MTDHIDGNGEGKQSSFGNTGSDGDAFAEQREPEESLAIKEERLRLALEVAEIGQWHVDNDTGFMYWPPRVKAMFGISADVPVTLDDYYNGVHPDDRQKTLDAYQAASDPERRPLYDVEYRTVGKEDSVVRWVAAKGRGLFDAKGTCYRMLGTAIDITSRKADELRLRELNDNLEAQVAARTADRNRMWRLSTDLMLVSKNDGTITAVNPAWTQSLGWSEAELVGRQFTDFVHADDFARTQNETSEIGRGRPMQHFENRYRHRNGSYRSFSWAAVSEDGLIQAVGRDITSEKEQADALKQAEEALRQSQKMEAVGQLTGGLAHDFNNLLGGISGSLELIRRRLGEGRVADIERYVEVGFSSAKRAAALTHRLLAFARRQTLEPRPLNVNRMVHGMEDLVRRTMGPQIQVEVIAGMGLWTVQADASQLENALLNLCINSRDAMPEGGTLTIETANRRIDDRTALGQDIAPGQYVSMCVSDNGVGMPPAVIARAFDPFFTTKPTGLGTGLGLSMIWGFAKQSGGHARIYSEVGQGTMVCVYLPRHLGAAAMAEENLSTIEQPPRAASGQTVLVLDDEPSVRMFMAEVLRELGYVIVEAETGAEALKVLHSSVRVDLLISDVGLPGGMNGRQVADAARVVRPNLKVLFITGYAENAVLSHGHLDPGMHVMTKPFELDALARRAKELIESQ